MALTKGQLRDLIRQNLGDEERVTGTAQAGSSTTKIVDSTNLAQANGTWSNQKVYIKTTSDNGAPKNQTRRIVTSTQSDTSVTVSPPFNPTVEAGDTFGVAVFSDSQIDNVVSGVLKEFSQLRPRKFDEPLSLTSGQKRFAPTSAAEIINVTMIEYYNPPEHFIYDANTGYPWFWNETLRKVEFEYFFPENKTVTLYGTKPHVLPDDDEDSLTIALIEEDDILQWCCAALLSGMSQREFHDDYGSLRPKTITRGQVTESYGNSHEVILQQCRDIINGIKSKYTVAMSLNVTQRAGFSVNRKSDPDGWSPPQVFWHLN